MALVLSKIGESTMEEKRSKFIGFCASVKSEEEARNLLDKIRCKHSSATHNVYAYNVGSITRFSDDGEPQGTSGMPVLNVFLKKGITNFICVVTRYYGGILLGAGGLVRAYTKAANAALETAGVEEQFSSTIYKVTCDYSQLDKVKYQFNKWRIEILETLFTHQCTLTVRVRDDLAEPFLKGDFYIYKGGKSLD